MKNNKYKRHKPTPADPWYTDYAHKLSEADKQWLYNFNKEYHLGHAKMDITKNKLLKSQELVNEAIRNHNVEARDALRVANKKNTLFTEDDITNFTQDEEVKQFMEDAYDEWTWRDEYARSGYDPAKRLIFERIIDEFDLTKDKKGRKSLLERFFINYLELKMMNKTKLPKERNK